jgi:hypothetical protein
MQPWGWILPAPCPANPHSFGPSQADWRINWRIDRCGVHGRASEWHRIWLHNRKRPAGEAGRFWGYYREERYVSLYMWIRGR